MRRSKGPRKGFSSEASTSYSTKNKHLKNKDKHPSGSPTSAPTSSDIASSSRPPRSKIILNVDGLIDAGWDEIFELPLRELVFMNMDAIFETAAVRLMNMGYSHERAVRSFLRRGILSGSKDPISNVVENAKVSLRANKEEHYKSFEEMKIATLDEAGDLVRSRNILISNCDAFWILLTTDMNISEACDSATHFFKPVPLNVYVPDKARTKQILLFSLIPKLRIIVTYWNEWANQTIMQAVKATSKIIEELEELREGRVSWLEVGNEALKKRSEREKARAEQEARVCEEASASEGAAARELEGRGREQSSMEEKLRTVKRDSRAAAREVETARGRVRGQMTRWRKEEKNREAEEERLSEATRRREAVEERWGREEKEMREKAHALSERVESLEMELCNLREEKNVKPLKSGRECVVCLTEEVSVVYLPCQHQVVCRACDHLLDERRMPCPSCRQFIRNRIPVLYT